ncbi:MAG: hypothetical protein WC221_04690 [Candidatus Riflebacteria bacterium]
MNNDLSKIERGAYTVYFNKKDETVVLELLKCLEDAEKNICDVFCLKVPYICTFFLLESAEELESIMGVTPKIGEKLRVDYRSSTILFYMDRIRSENIGEAALKELGHLIFNNMVDERENAVRQWRSPSWLREGFALQLSYLSRIDREDWLKTGWLELQSIYKEGKLIPLSVLEKDINYIPNPTRRYIALFQAYFMVRLLIVTCGDCFFENYANTMRRMPDSPANEVFLKFTNTDFEKFYGMFKICVENNADLMPA